MTTPTYIGNALNTVSRGSWSYLKPYDRHHLKFVTGSWAKAYFWQHLGLAARDPELVYMKSTHYASSEKAYMVVVRKLTDLREAPTHIQDWYDDETRQFPYGINTVGDLQKHDLSHLTWLQPALIYIRNTFTAKTPLGDDFGRANALWDEDTDEIVPHDMFNLDWMEVHGKILQSAKKNTRRKSW